MTEQSRIITEEQWQEYLKFKNQTQPLYMVVASFSNSIRDNLEIVDYNLTFDEANEIAVDLAMHDKIYDNEDWELDKSTGAKIIQQATRI